MAKSLTRSGRFFEFLRNGAGCVGRVYKEAIGPDFFAQYSITVSGLTIRLLAQSAGASDFAHGTATRTRRTISTITWPELLG